MASLTIMLLTYNRPYYAEKTLRSTLEHLKYDGFLQVHIADDGTPKEHYIDYLVNIAQDYGVESITFSNSGHMGYGANYNLGCQTVHPRSDYILPLEDDWELIKDFDATPIIEALDLFGCIRAGYVGYSQPLRCEFVSHNNHNWLRFDPASEEPHVFSGHPRFETVEWARRVGPWPTGMLPGATEFEVAHREAARQDVAWPIDFIKPSGDAWVHIGTERSY